MPIAWSPDGKRVATAVNLTTVQSWDTQTGQNVITYEVAKNSQTSSTSITNTISDASWSPDGSKLLVAENHMIYIFDASTAHLIRTFQPATASISGASATEPLAFMRNAQQTTPLSAHLPLSGGDIFGNAVWSPNGQYIAASYNSGMYTINSVIDIWDVTNGSLVKTLHGFTSNILSVSWSKQEQRLAAIGYDGITSTVVVWDTSSWTITRRFPGTGAFDWSPTGTQLALVEADPTGNNRVNIVDADTGTVVKQIIDTQVKNILTLHWSPDGTRLALETLAANKNGTMQISIWSVSSTAHLYTFPQGGVYEASWSPDSKYLACAQTKQKRNSHDLYMLTLIWVA